MTWLLASAVKISVDQEKQVLTQPLHSVSEISLIARVCFLVVYLLSAEEREALLCGTMQESFYEELQLEQNFA